MDDISNELWLISEVVAGIARVNPYSVPEGYFESLDRRIGQLMGSLTGGLQPISDPALPSVPRQNPYSIPEGYFGSFAEKLMARIKAEQAVTANDQEADSVLSELTALSPVLSRLNKQAPFEAPEEYFGELSGNIMAGVRAIDFVNDELENPSPVLSGLQPMNVYSTPDGYFEQLPQAVMNHIRKRGLPSASTIITDVRDTESRQTPVIPIGRRRWMRVASAAIVSGLILTAGWLHFSRPVGKTGEGGDAVLTASLSRVSDQEIENFVDTQHPSLSEVMASASPSATLDLSDADVKNMIGDVPDEELQQYLEDNGSQKDL